MRADQVIQLQRMIEQAMAFARCADRCVPEESAPAFDQIMLHRVADVNSAFACEVFLKALLLCYTESIPKEHKLHLLFQALPEPVQERIELRVRQQYGRWENGFGLSSLEGISDAFTKWRYAYEYNNLFLDEGFLLAFRNALFEECKTIHNFRGWA